MSTPTQIKIIHMLKGASGLDDQNYRALLSSFGVSSSTALSVDDARELIKKMEYLAIGAGWKSRKPMRWDHLDGRPGMATPLQLRHLEGLWVSVSRQPTLREKQESFNRFLENRFGIARIEWIPAEMVAKIKRSLIIMRKQNEKTNAKLQEPACSGAMDHRKAGPDVCVNFN